MFVKDKWDWHGQAVKSAINQSNTDDQHPKTEVRKEILRFLTLVSYMKNAHITN